MASRSRPATRKALKFPFQCTRPGYIPNTSAPIQCVRDPECRVVRPIAIAVQRYFRAAQLRSEVEYFAYDFDGYVAICQFNITLVD